MRHRKSGRKLGVTASHRKAMLSALCTALIRHKKIKTTLAKAKETRMFVEKIITRAKNAVATEGDKKNVHARREVYRTIRDRAVVTELFGEIAPKVASRPGGYTRVVKLGQRFGGRRRSGDPRARRLQHGHRDEVGSEAGQDEAGRRQEVPRQEGGRDEEGQGAEGRNEVTCVA